MEALGVLLRFDEVAAILLGVYPHLTLAWLAADHVVGVVVAGAIVFGGHSAAVIEILHGSLPSHCLCLDNPVQHLLSCAREDQIRLLKLLVHHHLLTRQETV